MEATFQSAGINTASISISNETNNSSAIASNSPASLCGFIVYYFFIIKTNN